MWLDDSVDDIRIFLRLFGLATPVKGGMWEKSWDPTLYDYVASLRVVEKYDMVLLRDVLHNKVSTLPDEFVDNMGHSKNEVFAILHLAHVLQSRPLWENICSHMGRWRHTLDLHRLKDDEVEWLGPELHAILIAIAAMSMGNYPYADTHNIRVHYDHGGWGLGWRCWLLTDGLQTARRALSTPTTRRTSARTASTTRARCMTYDAG